LDADRLARVLRSREGDVLEQALEDRVEAAGADVLERAVDALGVARDLADRLLGEGEVDALRLEERAILLQERALRLRQDPHEVGLRGGAELDADRKAALELGDQVGRLRDVEGARGDEEDVVRLDEPVLRVDRRALDDRKQVALDALARDVGAATARLAAGDLVDLVEEHDPGGLRPLDRLARDLAGVDQAALFLGLEDLPRLADRRLATLLLAAEEAGEHLLDVDVHLLDALVRHDLEGGERLVGDLHLDETVLE